MDKLSEVDHFINSFTRAHKFKMDPNKRWYNCSELNPNWRGSVAGNLTILFRGPKLDTIAMENSALLPILHFVMCKLNLEINWMFNLFSPVSRLKEDVLTLPPWFLYTSHSKFQETITFSQLFQIDILTTSRTIEDISFISFYKLFDHWIWSGILISFLSFLFICKYLMVNISYSELFWQLLPQLLSQSTKKYDILNKLLKYSKRNLGNTLILGITIWLLISMIISKSFSEGLLSTYFGGEVKPMVENIEDVIKKKGFKVMIQSRDGPKFREFMPDEFDRLNRTGKIEIIREMPNRNPTAIARIAHSVARGKTVLLISSFSTDFFKDYFMDSSLAISGRYSMNFLVLSISKRHHFGRQISDFLFNLTVAGLNIRTLNLIALTRQMKGRVISSQNPKDNHQLNDEKDEQINIKNAFRSWSPILIIGWFTSFLIFCIELTRLLLN